MEMYQWVLHSVLFWTAYTFRFSKGRLSLGEKSVVIRKDVLHEKALKIYSVVEHDVLEHIGK